MDPIDFIKVLAVVFAALFPVVNPIGDAPIFLSLTRQYPQSAQKVLARKIAAYGFALLAVSFLFGSEILSFFWRQSGGHSDHRRVDPWSDRMESAQPAGRCVLGRGNFGYP